MKYLRAERAVRMAKPKLDRNIQADAGTVGHGPLHHETSATFVAQNLRVSRSKKAMEPDQSPVKRATTPQPAGCMPDMMRSLAKVREFVASGWVLDAVGPYMSQKANCTHRGDG